MILRHLASVSDDFTAVGVDSVKASKLRHVYRLSQILPLTMKLFIT